MCFLSPEGMAQQLQAFAALTEDSRITFQHPHDTHNHRYLQFHSILWLLISIKAKNAWGAQTSYTYDKIFKRMRFSQYITLNILGGFFF